MPKSHIRAVAISRDILIRQAADEDSLFLTVVPNRQISGTKGKIEGFGESENYERGLENLEKPLLEGFVPNCLDSSSSADNSTH